MKRIGTWLDILGTYASWVCVAHCLLLPFLIGIIPFFGLSYILSESIELFLIVVTVLIALSSLLPAYLTQHGKLRSIVLALSGITLIILTYILFEENLIAQIIFLVAGATLISSAHKINRFLCQRCEGC